MTWYPRRKCLTYIFSVAKSASYLGSFRKKFETVLKSKHRKLIWRTLSPAIFFLCILCFYGYARKRQQSVMLFKVMENPHNASTVMGYDRDGATERRCFKLSYLRSKIHSVWKIFLTIKIASIVWVRCKIYSVVKTSSLFNRFILSAWASYFIFVIFNSKRHWVKLW